MQHLCALIKMHETLGASLLTMQQPHGFVSKVHGAATQIDLPHDVVIDASRLAYWLGS